MVPTVVAFTGGVIAMGYAVAGLFFLRFFIRSRDGLFIAFAAAFALMALNQTLQVVLQIPREEQSPIFLLRLSAFLLIIAAILGKNLRKRGPEPRAPNGRDGARAFPAEETAMSHAEAEKRRRDIAREDADSPNAIPLAPPQGDGS